MSDNQIAPAPKSHSDRRGYFVQICIAIMSVSVLGAVAFLCYHFLGIPRGGATYLSELTLVVTIVTIFTALFALAGVFLTHRSVDQAEQIRERNTRSEAESVARREEFEKEFAAKRSALNAMLMEATTHLAALKNSAAAFHPSGLFLAERIRSGGVRQTSTPTGELSGSNGVDQGSEDSSTQLINAIAERFAKAVEENAEFGSQVQDLFVGEEDEVRSSALYLEALAEKSSRVIALFAADLLSARLVLEKEKGPASSANLVDALSYSHRGVVEAERRMRPGKN